MSALIALAMTRPANISAAAHTASESTTARMGIFFRQLGK
jgi:hypothetical protein